MDYIDRQLILSPFKEAMSWLSKYSNPFGIFDYGWKTSPDQREYLDRGYGLAFDLWLAMMVKNNFN